MFNCSLISYHVHMYNAFLRAMFPIIIINFANILPVYRVLKKLVNNCIIILYFIQL